MKQESPNIYIEKRGKHEYWLASWRVEGKTKNVCFGSVAKMTRKEATAKACRLKLGYVACHESNLSTNISPNDSSIDDIFNVNAIMSLICYDQKIQKRISN